MTLRLTWLTLFLVLIITSPFILLQTNFSVVVGGFQLRLEILINDNTLLCLILVLLISGCVFNFSDFYIANDKFKKSFIFLLSLFVVSILVLLCGISLTIVIIGWDLLGVTSFLLILYYNNVRNIRSGLVTFTVNRFGDSMIMCALYYFLETGYLHLITLEGYLSLFLIIGALTKSAQFPFSMWLPLAMDAPTPVRALVHRSTLVTAGLFFLRRFDFFSNPVLIILGRVTFIIGATRACFTFDLKKLIAKSTLAHLGIITFSLGSGFKDLITFHLIRHALFKAGIFLLAGILLIEKAGCQDSRAVGSFFSPSLKCLSVYLSLSSLSLFSMSTYFSKHRILGLINNQEINLLILTFLAVGIISRVVYTLKLLTLFIGETQSTQAQCSELSMRFSVILLSIASLIFGNFWSITFLPPFTFERSLGVIWLGLIWFIVSVVPVSSILTNFWYLNSMMDNFLRGQNFKIAGFWRFKW